MSLKDILDKYDKNMAPKEGWFTVKDPSLEDVKKVVAKGKLEEKGFRIPLELRKYLNITPEGKLVEIQAVPAELQSLADDVRKRFYKLSE